MPGLGIEQAVLAGNTEPAYRMTYLVEQHPERVAGVIYLAGPPSAAGHLFKNPASGWPMLVRSWGLGEDFLEQDPYACLYLEDEDATISVPALTFVNPTGIRGVESWVMPLMDIGSPRAADDIAEMESSAHPAGPHYARLLSDVTFRDEQLARIEDPEVREYFQRLAANDSLQAEVERFHDEHILPAELAGWTAFREAFGEHLRVVELDVPVVVGYEYRDAPELIEPHIRRFLEEVDARNDSQ